MSNAQKELIAKLEMSYQKFMQSSLGRDIKENSNTKFTVKEFEKLMSNVKISLSVLVYEGREY